MDQTTAALIGAAIGAGGAVVAQVISAAFTARRETKRLQWEQSQARHAEEREKAREFLDVRRQAYVDVLALLDARHGKYLEWMRSQEPRREELRSALEGSEPDFLLACHEAASEIALMAPQIEDPVVDLVEVLWLTKNGTVPVEPPQITDDYFTQVEEVRRLMRSDLGMPEAEIRNH